jgi:hypothetical protein
MRGRGAAVFKTIEITTSILARKATFGLPLIEPDPHGSMHRTGPAVISPLLVRMHPLVRRDPSSLGQLDHSYRRSRAAFPT